MLENLFHRYRAHGKSFETGYRYRHMLSRLIIHCSKIVNTNHPIKINIFICYGLKNDSVESWRIIYIDADGDEFIAPFLSTFLLFFQIQSYSELRTVQNVILFNILHINHLFCTKLTFLFSMFYKKIKLNNNQLLQ